MKNLTNLTFTLFLMLVFPILESCELNQECGSSSISYYDYSTLKIEQQKDSYDESENYSYFIVYPIEEYQSRLPATTFGSSLMAEDIVFIPTHEIKLFTITSNHPFDSSSPNDLDITDHFEFYSMQEWVDIEQAQLDEQGGLFIRCMTLPDDLDQNYDLEFEILKSNNEIATGRLSNVTF